MHLNLKKKKKKKKKKNRKKNIRSLFLWCAGSYEYAACTLNIQAYKHVRHDHFDDRGLDNGFKGCCTNFAKHFLLLFQCYKPEAIFIFNMIVVATPFSFCNHSVATIPRRVSNQLQFCYYT